MVVRVGALVAPFCRRGNHAERIPQPVVRPICTANVADRSGGVFSFAVVDSLHRHGLCAISFSTRTAMVASATRAMVLSTADRVPLHHVYMENTRFCALRGLFFIRNCRKIAFALVTIFMRCHPERSEGSMYLFPCRIAVDRWPRVDSFSTLRILLPQEARLTLYP